MIAEGWISEEEMILVSKYMIKDNGSILEVGAANGRLFSFLYPLHPGWQYFAVDPWEREQVRLQVDWNKDYFEPGNLKEIITKDMFIANCPFATAYQTYYENFITEKKFDIISLGLIGKNINWNFIYNIAYNMLTPGGKIIGRNYNHKRYGEIIRSVAHKFNIIEVYKGSFVIGEDHV